MTISESVMRSAHEAIDAQPLVSDIEKAARAIVVSFGFDPDVLAIAYNPERGPKGCYLLPDKETAAPLWTFFDREAEAALRAVHK